MGSLLSTLSTPFDTNRFDRFNAIIILETQLMFAASIASGYEFVILIALNECHAWFFCCTSQLLSVSSGTSDIYIVFCGRTGDYRHLWCCWYSSMFYGVELIAFQFLHKICNHSRPNNTVQCVCMNKKEHALWVVTVTDATILYQMIIIFLLLIIPSNYIIHVR